MAVVQTRLRLGVLGVGLVAAAGVLTYFLVFGRQSSPTPPAPPEVPVATARTLPWFRDMTSTGGLHFTYRNGEEADQFAILESMGGGIALLDFDGDGLLDIFATGGGHFTGPEKKNIQGHPCQLFRNLGNWKFQDVTAQTGLQVEWWYTHGAAVADYDGDGWPDLLVTGYGRIALFHNESNGSGGRRFVDQAYQLGLRDDSWSTSAGWADLDGDGYPDLYVCHYVDWSWTNHPKCRGNALKVPRDVCSPGRFQPLQHALYLNEKGKGFRNVAKEMGFQATGSGLGVLLADLNDDGRPDIYVANDTNPKFLFFNRGGKLEEKGRLAGAAMDETGNPNGSMGVDAADYDGSGRPSLWVTNYQTEVHGLYRNHGKEYFHHQSQGAGIAAIGRSFVGFGTSFLDVDNDGWEDLVIANGHVLRFPVAGDPRQKPVLLRNEEFQDRRFFKDISPQGGHFFQTPALGRGLAIGDLDNDGWPDIVVSHTNSPIALLRNEAAQSVPAPNKWIGFRLVGKNHRDVVGSTIILESGSRKLTRFVKGGGSYLSASDPRLLFGLGATGANQRVTVKWAWGRTQTWEGLDPNRYWELQEDRQEPKMVPNSSR